MIKRWVSEPLLHFLVLGAALFAAYAYLEPASRGVDATKQIHLTLDDLRQMDVYFQAQWRRPPTAEELTRLIESKVQDEILYREGLAMGLDKDDSIVKRRLAQKVQFLTEDVAAAREPSSDELKSWYSQNAKQFAMPGRVSFRHLYFSPDRRGSRVRDDAQNALAKLTGQPQDIQLADSFSDRFMFQEYYRDRAPDNLSKEFGPQFASAVTKLQSGKWEGPIESGFGWHLVFVDTVIPGRIPAFEEVEPSVKAAWLGEQKAQAWQKAYSDIRAKYTIFLPASPNTNDGATTSTNSSATSSGSSSGRSQ